MDIKDKINELRKDGYIEGELSIDPLWYIIWEPENVIEYNEDYEISKYSPGFTAFGDSGSNELLAVNDKGEVYTLPAIGMSIDSAIKVADSVDDLKQYMELTS